MEFLEQNRQSNVPGDPDPDQYFSDSSLTKKKCDKKKNLLKQKRDDLSDLSSGDNSDSSYDSDYIRKRHKMESNQKNDPVKLCARSTAKLLMKAYKSKITRFKMYEDPLQRRIYFLTFV